MNTPATAPSLRSLLGSHRLWLSAIFLVITLTGLAVARLKPELDANFRSWFVAAVLIVGVLLQVIWFLFFSRFPGRVRLITLGLLIALGFAASKSLKVDGVVNGTGLPKLAWRWSEDKAGDLPAPVQAVAGSPSHHDDLLDKAVPGGADVVQFFGSSRDGVVRETALNAQWAQSPPKELWRQPVGAGWSAFAVVGGRAFTQEQRGDQELVTCYDLLTGRLLWSHADRAHFSQWQGGDGPRATPTVVDDRVYSYGATGILNCLDARSGQRLWTQNVLKQADSANLEWGTSSSPLVFDDKVAVTGGKAAGPVLFAFQRDTGELAWRAGHDQASYASPSLGTVAGRQVIFSNNATALTLHDPASGTVLAEHPWGDARWPKASQPVLLPGDRVFLSAGYGMGCQMLQISAAKDGTLQVTELWRGLRMKTQFNSAAFDGAHLYGLDDGRMVCLDPATGDRLWKEGRFGSGQSLMIGHLVLIQSEPGPVILASAKPEGFVELGQIPALSSRTWNHPTLAGRYLLVRNDREAVCYELPVITQAAGQ